MSWTDICLLLLTALAMLRGASRGFTRSVIGPMAFIIATAGAFLYYKITKDIVISVAIGILGPFVLSLGLKMLLGSVGAGNKDNKLGTLSRTTGAGLTALWVIVLALPIVFILALLPPVHPSLTALRKDIHRSFSYRLLTPFVPAAPAVGNADAVKSLQEDQRMQNLIEDPDVLRALRRKDYVALMSHPKIMASAQDPQFIQKILAAYQEINQAKQ